MSQKIIHIALVVNDYNEAIDFYTPKLNFDLLEDYQQLHNNGVQFVRPPSEELYGMVVVFQDLYVNLWDLIDRKV